MTMTSTGPDTTFNGWANYHTWNVALYIQNEYELYRTARGCDNYQAFLDWSGLEGHVTPDGVSYTDPELDLDELDEMVSEL